MRSVCSKAGDPKFDRAYFDVHYRNYAAQNPQRKLDHYLRVISPLVPPDARVIDIGCGLALWAAHISDQNPSWDVHAMDVDPEVVARNAEQFPTVSFRVGRLGQVLDLEPVDLVTMMDVLEHVPDVAMAFESALSYVKPGGWMVFVVPVYDGPLGPLLKLMDSDPTHIHKWGREAWLALARCHLDEVAWHGLFRLYVPPSKYMHLSSKRLRMVAPAVMIAGRVRV